MIRKVAERNRVANEEMHEGEIAGHSCRSLAWHAQIDGGIGQGPYQLEGILKSKFSYAQRRQGVLL